MSRQKKNYHGFYILLLVFIPLNSCRKFVTVGAPVNQVVSQLVFSNDSTAVSVIRGIYGQMSNEQGFISGDVNSITTLAGLSADEFTNYYSGTSVQDFASNNITASNDILYGALWQNIYKYINNANAVIDGLATSKTVSVITKNELTGEALFIRAFCNFYLVNMYGDVPLVLSTDYRVNSIAARTPIADVYKSMVADLTKAQQLLSEGFNFSGGERDQPNKTAATALLARVYLYSGDWPNASLQSTNVIQSAGYNLLQDLNKVFLANSAETIWQIKPITNGANINTKEGANFIISAPPTIVTLAGTLMANFENNDQRRLQWVGQYISGTDTFYYPYKYKVRYSPVLTEYSVVLRLAEQYLIRAEAKIYLNDYAAAKSDLNLIRLRAGLPAVNFNSKDSLLNAVYHERQVELFTENGQRWFDLKRTGQADKILSLLKSPGWQATDKLYPIPNAEILLDKMLVQNAGY